MGQPTTRLQVSGHRFMARRMEHALVRGDTQMIDDPLRGQKLSLICGAVLAVIGVAICAVLAFVRPGANLGDAHVVVVRESGAMYVRIDDVLHPVFNLASARLIVGSAVEPRVVSQRAVEHAELGSRVGIPEAPDQISPPLSAEESRWTVCDDQHATTVFAGPVSAGGVAPGRSVLVTPRGGSAALTYLLHGGWRSRVDLRHGAVVRALRIDGVAPQSVSPEVLAAIPEGPAIAPPHIADAGRPGPGILRDHPVGSVVTSGGDRFVVLADGLQRIGEVAADLIRYTDERAGAAIPTVSSAAVGSLPVVTSLPVTTYPGRGGVVTDPVVCAQWTQTLSETGSHTDLLVGTGLPTAAPPIGGVSVPAGRSVFVRSVGLTGTGRSAGSLFLLVDSGLLHGVRDDETAAALGLAQPAVPAPWPILATLPRGPELSRDAASVARQSSTARQRMP
ncbi:type VII secretion protein EccB [Mycolicibacterium iranicum]|uniref:Type VII secretion protein EccB n=1 Tax=Mycolicibacterium iranicum TaxID=912594 RepID=A0A178LRM4_MYCIR|nr:type VII secretion protein EccB [Mycolicibacterium iranicum]OAN34510.1 type VII secretion protein EccB [Mycolicibacterium iranicum]